MPSVITFNPDSAVVPNRVTGYKRSVQESDWAGVPNSILYYDPSGDPPHILQLLHDLVPISEWKVEGSIVVALTQADKDALAAQAAIDAAAAAAAARIAETQALKASLSSTNEALPFVFKALVKVLRQEIIDQVAAAPAKTANQLLVAIADEANALIDARP